MIAQPLTDYRALLARKRMIAPLVGKSISRDAIHPALYGFQGDSVAWALSKGRAALFFDTGLGKTICQLEFVRHIEGRRLIIAPLAVAFQTIEHAREHLGLEVQYVLDQSRVDGDGIYITNYERIDKFDMRTFAAVVLDESSILKNFGGSTRTALIRSCKTVPYRLCCSATPAPNDIMEIGNHAEFLGVMTAQQMTSVFFKHDAAVFQGTAARWRLKRHAEQDFYRWMASWSAAVKRPSDLGYSDEGYDLPPLNLHIETIDADWTPEGMLPGFHVGGISATDARAIRRDTITERVEKVAALVNGNDDHWLIWAGLNDEAEAITAAIPDAINVEGKMKPDDKVAALLGFANGDVRVLVTKSSIAGMGLNLQKHCHRMVFAGIDYSWEQYYQSIRRVQRYGQEHSVDVHIVITEAEQQILDVVRAKEQQAVEMTEKLIAASRGYLKAEMGKAAMSDDTYQEDTIATDRYTLMLGDAAQRMAELPDASVDMSVYSPPFFGLATSMYVFSNLTEDLSNCADADTFFGQYAYIIRENLRITKPGRICWVHVQDPKVFKNQEGWRGISDFTGRVIQAYVDEGWIFRSRITIDKNPQIVASRNKDTDLLFITGKRDAADLAPMATDYLLMFKAPGENDTPITPYANGEMTEDEWIQWAHAVWYSIRETNVLNVRVAKGNDDEKHMSPLQLDVIERCIRLSSNPGELVFSPFGGIGSEGYVAIKLGRRATLIELKPEYFKVAHGNLEQAVQEAQQGTLFELLSEEVES